MRAEARAYRACEKRESSRTDRVVEQPKVEESESMITTHVLDMAQGRPAGGLTVILEMRHQSEWIPVGRGSTDDNGRLTTLTEDSQPLSLGTYRLTFDTGTYHRDQGIASPFFPEVKIFFNVDGAGGHYHLPLLLSPYGYSTYRGS